jgi:hypothetical protein
MQELARGARDLTTAVAAMRADFASAHAAMAKQTRGERETFVTAVIDEVNSLLGEFSRDRKEMARNGRHDRGVFISEMRRQVMGMCKDTADDLMGARLAWRGERPGKSRPVPMKKKPVVVKPIPPPMEAALKKKAAAPEVKTVNPPKVKTQAPVVDAMPFQKSKEKSWLDEKPAKAATKAKRGRKK